MELDDAPFVNFQLFGLKVYQTLPDSARVVQKFVNLVGVDLCFETP